MLCEFYVYSDWLKSSKSKYVFNNINDVSPASNESMLSSIDWQVFESSDGSFYLYGAYLDVRKNNRLGPTVRILGMINRLEPQVKTYCQLWFSDTSEAVISKVLEYKYIWYKKWGNYKQAGDHYQPFLMSCQIPLTHWGQVPISVSLAESNSSKSSDKISVIFDKPNKGESEKIAVCVKALNFPQNDISPRLIEWMEFLRIFGVNKVYFHILNVQRNTLRVIQHYQEHGIVDVKAVEYLSQDNVSQMTNGDWVHYKRRQEIVTYNDCFYRNMYGYKYIALLDIDEIIVPGPSHSDWLEMMEAVVNDAHAVLNTTRAAWSFKTEYFLDDNTTVKTGLHMLDHTNKTVGYNKPNFYYDKAMFNPDVVLLVHNHYPLACLGIVYY